jgi:type II secretory pathway component PulF
MIYEYTGRDIQTGLVVRGSAQGNTIREIVDGLRKDGIRASQIIKSQSSKNVSTLAKKARIHFFRGYATLAVTGMQTEEIMQYLSEQTRGAGSGVLKILKKATQGMLRDSTRAGMSLPQAMRKQPQLFTAIDAGIVEAGVETGQLVTTMEQYADQLEAQMEFDSQFKNALVQPAIGLGAAALSFPGICAALTPVLRGMYHTSGATPPPTFAEIAFVGDLARGPWLWVTYVLLIAAFVVANKKGYLQPLLRKLPVIGVMLRARATEMAARIFGQAYASGKSAEIACQFAASTVEDPQLEKAFHACSEALLRGEAKDLPTAMEQQGNAFDPIFVQYIRMARGARVPEMCQHVAKLSQRQAKDVIDRLPAIMNAVAMVTVGTLIGLMAYYVYSAISYSIAHIGQTH